MLVSAHSLQKNSMKLSLLLVVFLFAKCNQAKDGEGRKNDAGIAVNNVSDTTGKKSLKGWELYSWFDKEWKFVLVPGTNRIKTVEEIISSKQISNGIKELEKRIMELNNHQTIVWMDRTHNKDLKVNEPFQKPTAEITDNLMEICKRKDIELLIR